MKSIFLVAIILASLFFSCRQPAEKKTAEKSNVSKNLIGKPTVELAMLTKDFNSFWKYYNQYALLHQDFIAFNENGVAISKIEFLQSLQTGIYLPLVVYGKTSRPNFKLAKIPASADSNIAAYMKQDSEIETAYDQMKGKPIPKFNFKDINGRLYTSENTKGKIVLFKCWFISCVACVEEMPALNKLVKKYRKRKDILFISLAIDDKFSLQHFLEKTKFDYAIIPNQENYMNKILHVRMYPTHFLINKKGSLIDVVSDERTIAELLEKEVGR